jgi:fibronectin type 3 domain-containing protein
MNEAGYHMVNWDASDVSAGMYIVRMEAGDFIGSIKCTLVK